MRKFLITATLCLLLVGTALAAQTTITQEGSFDQTIRKQINDNFTELFSGTSTIAGDKTYSGAQEFDGAVDFDSTITIGSTAVSATGIELNYNDIATLGTLAASKTWSSDASLDTIMPTGGLLTVQSGGVFDFASGSTIDIAGTFEIANVGMTSSAAELNYSDIATLGTLAASKTWSSDASLDTIMPTGGLLTVQSGGQITLDSGSTLAVSGTFTAATETLTGDLSGDGGDQFFGFLQDQVASTTVAITAAQAAKTFVSNSADVMTLPEASTVLGARYTFVCGTADDFDINPADGTDQIGSISTTNGTTAVVTLAPAAGDAIRCTDIGGSITLEAVGADLWAQVAGGNGIWTDVN